MSWRLLHFAGLPTLFGVGRNGSSTAHCASVRSYRLATATLGTRSPEDRTSWSKNHLPETSLHVDHRHADHHASAQLSKHGLAVLPTDVGDAGDGWFASECGVG